MRAAPLALALLMAAAATVIAEEWDEAYHAGLAALARGDHRQAADALRRAIALRPEPQGPRRRIA